MADERFLVVGLGNPGPRYAATRHNAGFFVLDELADRVGGSFRVHKASGGRAEVVEGRLAGQPAVLVKPRSYMNESGGPVVSISRFYKVDVERIVVVHDELDLPFGTIRLKRGGGEGGHNGLKWNISSTGRPTPPRRSWVRAWRQPRTSSTAEPGLLAPARRAWLPAGGRCRSGAQSSTIEVPPEQSAPAC
jgi:peptidyl-tRNA hydrolase